MVQETGALAEVKQGYEFSGATVELGALVVDGNGVRDAPVRVPLAMLNRHGLVAGATGTGKTKTLQVIAEQLSDAGVPVFLADIKGDVSGMAVPGTPSDKLTARCNEIGQLWRATGYPCEFYTLGGRGTGIPLRATMTAFGPTLLAKVLDLTDVQTSSLHLIFHFADQAGLPLLDVKDLRAVIQYLTSEEGETALRELGGLSKQTAGVLLRELVKFTDAGAEDFFGEPELEIGDLLRTTPDGKGVVSILELPGVVTQPALFSSFLMWLLAELFQHLPEVGDQPKPKLVFFFDEAHLLFRDASKEFLESITQTVRLIRSKGVGIFFVTQTPKDVHPDVLAQLGNRIQHALRAYTPDDAKALKATVSTFPRSSYDLGKLLTELGIGEAVVTVLNEDGVPTPVAWTKLRSPQSAMEPAPAELMASTVQSSPLHAKYAEPVDRDSAYERLSTKLAAPTAPSAQPAPAPAPGRAQPGRSRPAKRQAGAVNQMLGSKATQSMLRSAARAAGTAVVRSIFNTARRR